MHPSTIQFEAELLQFWTRFTDAKQSMAAWAELAKRLVPEVERVAGIRYYHYTLKDKVGAEPRGEANFYVTIPNPVEIMSWGGPLVQLHMGPADTFKTYAPLLAHIMDMGWEHYQQSDDAEFGCRTERFKRDGHPQIAIRFWPSRSSDATGCRVVDGKTKIVVEKKFLCPDSVAA